MRGVTLTHSLCITSPTPLLTCPFIRHTCGVVSFAYFHTPLARTTPPMQRPSETSNSRPARGSDRRSSFFFYINLSWGLWQEGFQSGVRGPPTGPLSGFQVNISSSSLGVFHPPLSFLEDYFLIPVFSTVAFAAQSCNSITTSNNISSHYNSS